MIKQQGSNDTLAHWMHSHNYTRTQMQETPMLIPPPSLVAAASQRITYTSHTLQHCPVQLPHILCNFSWPLPLKKGKKITWKKASGEWGITGRFWGSSYCSSCKLPDWPEINSKNKLCSCFQEYHPLPLHKSVTQWIHPVPRINIILNHHTLIQHA